MTHDDQTGCIWLIVAIIALVITNLLCHMSFQIHLKSLALCIDK